MAFIGTSVSVASAASAAPADAASFSRDGLTFTAEPLGALFDGIGAMVPRQRETARLWVRNDGTSALVIRVNVTAVHADDPDYAAALSLSAATTTRPSGASMTFATTESCFLLLGEQYLRPGETIPITVRLAMADVDGRVAQDSTASATLAVGMRDASAPWVADGVCDGDGAHLPVLSDSDPGTATPTTTPTPAAPASASGPLGPLGGSLSSTGTDALTWLLASVALITGGALAVLIPLRTRRNRSS